MRQMLLPLSFGSITQNFEFMKALLPYLGAKSAIFYPIYDLTLKLIPCFRPALVP